MARGSGARRPRRAARPSLIVCGLLAAGGLLALDRLLPPPPLLDDDLHLIWLLQGRDYFVDDHLGGRVTNPELLRLENSEQRFPAAKRERTLRVFCVGGSTTQGWPFGARASYPLLLSRILSDALPTRRIEIVNAGFNGSDSWSDRGLVDELSFYRPDALILYEGRNETWDFRLHSGWKAAALDLYLRLLRSVRLCGWARLRFQPRSPLDQIEAVRTWAERSGRVDASRLEPYFKKNMAAMIETMARRGCPVLLLSQVVSPEEDAVNPRINAINGWIRDLAREKKVRLVDLDSAFRGRRRDGDSLLIPYPATHPDLPGYELMARLVARALREEGRLAPASDWRWEDVRSDAEYERVLRADDPAYLAGVYGRLAAFFDALGGPETARRYRMRTAALQKEARARLGRPRD